MNKKYFNVTVPYFPGRRICISLHRMHRGKNYEIVLKLSEEREFLEDNGNVLWRTPHRKFFTLYKKVHKRPSVEERIKTMEESLANIKKLSEGLSSESIRIAEEQNWI